MVGERTKRLNNQKLGKQALKAYGNTIMLEDIEVEAKDDRNKVLKIWITKSKVIMIKFKIKTNERIMTYIRKNMS